MQQPRLLVVSANPVLTASYRQRLQRVGVAVEVAADGECALSSIAGECPDMVALDLVLPSMDGVELVRNVRAQPRFNGLPIVVMPTIHRPMLESAEAAGITRVLTRGDHPANELADLARAVFHLPRRTGLAPLPATLPARTPGLIADIRACLQNLTRDARDPGEWKRLFQKVHHAAEAVALAGENTLSAFAFAFEGLAGDLAATPDACNPSVLRTLSQAADFLAILLERTDRADLDRQTPASVLVVDDEPSALQLIGAALTLAGLQSKTALTPAAAIRLASGHRFDLIFLDIGLPEMTGFDVCSRIRATEGHDRTPIVFLTGMNTFQNRAKSSLSGGNDFVGKPFHVLELGVKALIWLHRGRLGLV